LQCPPDHIHNFVGKNPALATVSLHKELASKDLDDKDGKTRCER